MALLLDFSCCARNLQKRQSSNKSQPIGKRLEFLKFLRFPPAASYTHRAAEQKHISNHPVPRPERRFQQRPIDDPQVGRRFRVLHLYQAFARPQLVRIFNARVMGDAILCLVWWALRRRLRQGWTVETSLQRSDATCPLSGTPSLRSFSSASPDWPF